MESLLRDRVAGNVFDYAYGALNYNKLYDGVIHYTKFYFSFSGALRGKAIPVEGKSSHERIIVCSSKGKPAIPPNVSQQIKP